MTLVLLQKRIIKIAILCLLSLPRIFGANNDKDIKSDDLNHGEKQVEALLADRPQLQTAVKASNNIRDWLVGAFNYSADGIKIYWDSKSISGAFSGLSETNISVDSKICLIRANRYFNGADSGKEIDPETLISHIAFELCNARHHQGFVGLVEQAKQGAISKDQFIINVAQIEYESEKDLKLFATNIWFPYCLENGINPNEKIWVSCWPPTFEEWMKVYPRGSEYPWKLYGYRYDQITDKDQSSKKEELLRIR